MGGGAAAVFFAGGWFLMLPLLLLVHVGWWCGKRIAFRTLSLRGAATGLAVIAVITLLFYPGMFLFSWSRLLSRDFAGHIQSYSVALCFAFFSVGLSAAIAWVLYIGELSMQRRKQNEAAQEGGR